MAIRKESATSMIAHAYNAYNRRLYSHLTNSVELYLST